jgi:hypothetical protein
MWLSQLVPKNTRTVVEGRAGCCLRRKSSNEHKHTISCSPAGITLYQAMGQTLVEAVLRVSFCENNVSLPFQKSYLYSLPSMIYIYVKYIMLQVIDTSKYLG